MGSLYQVDEYNPKVAFNITGAGVDGGDYLGRKTSSNNNNDNNNNDNNSNNNRMGNVLPEQHYQVHVQ